MVSKDSSNKCCYGKSFHIQFRTTHPSKIFEAQEYSAKSRQFSHFCNAKYYGVGLWTPELLSNKTLFWNGIWSKRLLYATGVFTEKRTYSHPEYMEHLHISQGQCWSSLLIPISVRRLPLETQTPAQPLEIVEMTSVLIITTPWNHRKRKTLVLDLLTMKCTSDFILNVLLQGPYSVPSKWWRDFLSDESFLT